MPDFLGQRIGPYEIVALLGKGGMAEVYRARQTLSGGVKRDVALKLIDTRLSESSEFKTRFGREAQTLISLSHPHILKAFDYGQFQDNCYLVMELMIGGSLVELIRNGALPFEAISRLLDQIGSALDFAHSKGIIHRDLKPPNVLLDESGNAYLTDFGIVKLLSDTALTQTNSVLGTPMYMSPEQSTSGRVDARSDLYSLGVMLFEMLTGRVPFEGDTPLRVMYQHTYEAPPRVRPLRPDVPPNMDRVLHKALAKAPKDRYQTAAELTADFKAVLAGWPITAPTISRAAAKPSNQDLPTPLGSGAAAERTPETEAIVSEPQQPFELPPQTGNAPGVGRRRAPLVLGALAALVVVTIGSLVLALKLSASIAPTAMAGVSTGTAPAPTLVTPGSTDTAIALTNTPTFGLPTRIATPSPTVTPSPVPPTVNTPDKTGTVHAIAKASLTGQARLVMSFTPTHTPTLLPTDTSIATSIPLPRPATATFDPNRAAAPTLAARQTATVSVIASYTRTFTPTRTYTATSSPTRPYTPSATHTFTPVPPTATPTPSLLPSTPITTPSPTASDTSTPTNTLTPSATPIPTVTANGVWTPQTRSFNGVLMVLVPAGCFMMGSDRKKDPQARSDQQPQTKICFQQPFWLDLTPVTQSQFILFHGKAAKSSFFTGSNRPVEQITWIEANAYCVQQRSGRLPTEAEYEYASRGPDDLIYPWGNNFIGADVVYAGNSGNQTADVGSKPDGKSWVGALDMSGNVWEWTSSLFTPYPYIADDGREDTNDTKGERVLRGGSWIVSANFVRAAYRIGNFPYYVDSNTGFRCARPLEF